MEQLHTDIEDEQRRLDRVEERDGARPVWMADGAIAGRMENRLQQTNDLGCVIDDGD
jgi:hypothetical protein